MQTTTWKPWMPRIAAFAVGLMLAASVVFWVLRWPLRETGAALPVPAASDDLPAASASAITRLLGAPASPVEAAAAPDASSRFLLTGVVALGAGRGVALVSIDGKPAKPFRIGSQLEDGWVLQSVAARSIALGADATGPVRLKLELPPRQP
jgi:general secretion pathway protein C